MDGNDLKDIFKAVLAMVLFEAIKKTAEILSQLIG